MREREKKDGEKRWKGKHGNIVRELYLLPKTKVYWCFPCRELKGQNPLFGIDQITVFNRYVSWILCHNMRTDHQILWGFYCLRYKMVSLFYNVTNHRKSIYFFYWHSLFIYFVIHSLSLPFHSWGKDSFIFTCLIFSNHWFEWFCFIIMKNKCFRTRKWNKVTKTHTQKSQLFIKPITTTKASRKAE